MKRLKRALYWTIGVELVFLLLITLSGGNIFEEENFSLSIILSIILFGIPSLFFPIKTNKGKSEKTMEPLSNAKIEKRTIEKTDFFDPKNIPNHWVKARACVDGEHEGVTVSHGDATHCFKCGRPFDGVWGDRGVFDGYWCQVHNKWIPRGDFCTKCKESGLIS